MQTKGQCISVKGSQYNMWFAKNIVIYLRPSSLQVKWFDQINKFLIGFRDGIARIHLRYIVFCEGSSHEYAPCLGR